MNPKTMLKQSLNALNQMRNTTLTGDYKDSYEVCAKLARTIKEMDDPRTKFICDLGEYFNDNDLILSHKAEEEILEFVWKHMELACSTEDN